MNILVINGPNLNLLGKREPEVYGHRSLEQIMQSLVSAAEQDGIALTHFQANAEHQIIERLHAVLELDQSHPKRIHGIVINPGAFTHTSIAIRDAMLGIDTPFVEVHLSNVHARESFRHHSYFSDVAQGVVVGFGEQGYHMALQGLANKLREQAAKNQ